MLLASVMVIENMCLSHIEPAVVLGQAGMNSRHGLRTARGKRASKVRNKESSSWRRGPEGRGSRCRKDRAVGEGRIGQQVKEG